MTESTIAITLFWVLVFIYAIAGSIDFGAGFWSMVYMGKHQTKAGELANRFLSPLWEVTNVFLVLFVVLLVGFFPNASYELGTLLLIPGSIILILLALRSAFMVYAFTEKRYRRPLRIVSGLTGLFIPGLLVTVLPIAQGGFITHVDGAPQLLLGKLLTSPTEYAYVAFGIGSELFLSALLLADYSRVAGDISAFALYRRHALWLGPATLFAAVLTTIYMRPEATWLMQHIEARWPLFALSVVAFLVGYSALVWPRKGQQGVPRISVIAVIVQYALASAAYGIAHLPYMVYPDLTVASSFTNVTMFRYLLLACIIGFAILFPGFIWFWRLFMSDKRYVARK